MLAYVDSFTEEKYIGELLLTFFANMHFVVPEYCKQYLKYNL